MAQWLFSARQRFTPAHPGWRSYLEFSGFTHVAEVVTLDSILCADLVETLLEEDWNHNVQADYRLTWFTDVVYLRQRLPWRADQHQILAMAENPTQQQPVPPGFEFCGFDILDGYDDISVLTNCGQFLGQGSGFTPADINPRGLLPDLHRARKAAAQLRSAFPDDPHCGRCQVWQVARDRTL